MLGISDSLDSELAAAAKLCKCFRKFGEVVNTNLSQRFATQGATRRVRGTGHFSQCIMGKVDIGETVFVVLQCGKRLQF